MVRFLTAHGAISRPLYVSVVSTGSTPASQAGRAGSYPVADSNGRHDVFAKSPSLLPSHGRSIPGAAHFFCGCSSAAEHRPSKPGTRVRVPLFAPNASVAQLAERRIRNAEVVRSVLTGGSTRPVRFRLNGRGQVRRDSRSTRGGKVRKGRQPPNRLRKTRPVGMVRSTLIRQSFLFQDGPLAQLAERAAVNREAEGSRPSGTATCWCSSAWQSGCFVSSGAGDRSPPPAP